MNLSSFLAVRFGEKRERATARQARTNDGDALARLARLIYDEMDTDARQMHVAIQLAREQLHGLRDVLVAKGLRRDDSVAGERRAAPSDQERS